MLRKVNNCWEKLSFQRNIENWREKLSLLKIAGKIRVLLNFAEQKLSIAEKNWVLLRKNLVLLRKIDHCLEKLNFSEKNWAFLRKIEHCWEKLSIAEKNWVSWEIAEKSSYPWAWPGRSSRWCWARRPLRPLVFHKLLEACDHGLVISKCRRLPRLSHFLL